MQRARGHDADARDPIITAEQFRAQVPTGWTVDRECARATFRTGSFAAGVRFVVEVGAAAEALDHHPDIELTYRFVTVATTTHDVGGLTARDVDLARRVADIARALDAPVDRPDAPAAEEESGGGRVAAHEG